jgi:hypothetical protein
MSTDDPRPDHTLPGDLPPDQPPVTIWPSPGHPAHPIYYPPSIWPSPGVPTHPIFYPPGIWPSPGHPAHPIYWPPSIWPSPGVPTHPIVLPGGPGPSHPIVIPEPPEQPAPIEPEGGWWCACPGRAPLAYVKADTPENAAYNYGRTFAVPVGENILVATEVEAFVVGVDAAEVSHHE